MKELFHGKEVFHEKKSSVEENSFAFLCVTASMNSSTGYAKGCTRPIDKTFGVYGVKMVTNLF